MNEEDHLTAYAGEVNQQQTSHCAEFGLHISKPVEPKGLVKALAHLLKH